ncbi:MAG: 1,4-alpha-glucan branching protein domain-containing protein [Nitriliruptoraceae bacterium]
MTDAARPTTARATTGQQGNRTPGEFALVLHTHLPELRHHGVWPVGEEWLFEAWGTSWLPVTAVLERLAAEGHRELLTLGVTPAVAHQVADARVAKDLGTWLGGQMWRAEEQRWHLHLPAEVRDLAGFHWQRFQELLALHEDVERRGGLLAVWRELADAGVIELLGGPATHPYLPLTVDPALVDAQLAMGLEHHRTWAGRRPRGLWPPELGYRPAGRVADASARPRRVDATGTPTLPRIGPELPGLEHTYATHGIDHLLVDAATLVRAVGGPDRDWTARPEVPEPGTDHPDEVVHDAVWIGDSDVAAFARDLSVAYHVWSPSGGYPGNVWYRDYFARGTFGTHPSWRVTDHALPPDRKAIYEPGPARAQVARDVDHLHGVLRSVLDPRPGKLVVAAYDTELFGHWWFEGVAFLEALLRTVVADPALRTTTLGSRLQRQPPTRRLHLPESSWGYAKGHASWVTADTRAWWQRLHAAEAHARRALAGGRGTQRQRAAVARELAQLQASDWPFMATRGASPGYAHDRIDHHTAALHRLCAAIEAGTPDGDHLAEREARVLAPVDVAALVAALDPPGGTAAQPVRRP